MLSAREFCYKMIERDNIEDVVSDNTHMIVRMSNLSRKMFAQQNRKIRFLSVEMALMGTGIYILIGAVKKFEKRIDTLERAKNENN